MNKTAKIIILCILLVALGLAVAFIAIAVSSLQTSPAIVADQFLRYLADGDYDHAFLLLDKDAQEKAGHIEEFVQRIENDRLAPKKWGIKSIDSRSSAERISGTVEFKDGTRGYFSFSIKKSILDIKIHEYKLEKVLVDRLK